MNSSYGFADEHGNEITRGMQCTFAAALAHAQRLANERGGAVEFWDEDDDDDDSNVVWPQSRFRLGRVMTTPGADSRVSRARILQLLRLHGQGNWGACDEEDAATNERALTAGGRILSVYPIDAARPYDGDNRVWIITEADRSATTVLLPEEY